MAILWIFAKDYAEKRKVIHAAKITISCSVDEAVQQHG